MAGMGIVTMQHVSRRSKCQKIRDSGPNGVNDVKAAGGPLSVVCSPTGAAEQAATQCMVVTADRCCGYDYTVIPARAQSNWGRQIGNVFATSHDASLARRDTEPMKL